MRVKNAKHEPHARSDSRSFMNWRKLQKTYQYNNYKNLQK